MDLREKYDKKFEKSDAMVEETFKVKEEKEQKVIEFLKQLKVDVENEMKTYVNGTVDHLKLVRRLKIINADLKKLEE